MASSRPGVLAGLLLAGLALAVSACGSGEESPPDTVRAPAETVPETTTATPPSNAVNPRRKGEDQEGGAGDEEPIRVPAIFTFTKSGDIRPTVVAVPSFFAIQLQGVSRDGRPHELLFQGTTVSVPAGGKASARLEGLKAGRYGVTVDGRENAVTIVSGAEPGP